jgi:hypothetical protein
MLVIEQTRIDAVDPEYATRLAILRARQAETPDRPVLLAVGSSRVMAAFVPEQLPPLYTHDGRPVLAINFAHTGAGPATNHLMLTRLFRDGARPKWVLVEVMAAFVAHEDRKPLAGLCTLRDLAAVHGWASLGPAYLAHRIKDAPDVVRRAVAEPVPAHEFWRLGGYATLRDVVPPAERDWLMARQAAHYKNRLGSFRVSDDADHALRATVRLCREHGTWVGLLLTPEGSALRQLYGSGCEERFRDYVTRLGRELDVPVIDTRDWLRDDEFGDREHATRRGAARFTARLGREVLEPLVAAQ